MSIQQILYEIDRISSKFEPLTIELVEKGKIWKWQIENSENLEIGMLVLEGFSKIKKHEHKDGWEIYYNLKSKKIVDVCKIDESHQLENNTDEPIYILYIKSKNGVPLPDNEEIKKFVG